MSSFNWFPLTKYYYAKAKKRWNEPIDHEEQVGYCGPPDRPCVDCFFCLTPVYFAIDIATLNTFQCQKYKIDAGSELEK